MNPDSEGIGNFDKKEHMQSHEITYLQTDQ